MLLAIGLSQRWGFNTVFHQHASTTDIGVAVAVLVGHPLSVMSLFLHTQPPHVLPYDVLADATLASQEHRSDPLLEPWLPLNLLLLSILLTMKLSCPLTAALLALLLSASSPVMGTCLVTSIVIITLIHTRRTSMLDACIAAALAVLLHRHTTHVCTAALHIVTVITSGDQREMVTMFRSPSIDFSTLAPDMSLYWYLNSLALTRFLPYLRVIMWAHPFMYPIPVALRLGFNPCLALAIVAGLIGIVDPSRGYSSQFIPAVGAAILLHPRVVDEMKSVYLWTGLHVLAVVSFPAMKYAWIVAHTGNANLMFNLQLGYALASGCVIINVAAALLRLRKLDRIAARANGDKVPR